MQAAEQEPEKWANTPPSGILHFNNTLFELRDMCNADAKRRLGACPEVRKVKDLSDLKCTWA